MQERYRTLSLKDMRTGRVYEYKETHEGVKVFTQGRWCQSVMFQDLDVMAKMASSDADEWEVTWG